MPHQTNSPAAELFSREPRNAAVAVADGYGVTISVSRGHLLITDGIGQHRRTRTLPRAQRAVRRIVILGHTGTLTLDAVRWCADTGVALTQIDTDGRVLMLASTPARTDPRLLRAQAAAASSDTGVGIARHLLQLKLDGQAGIADQLGATDLAAVIREYADQLSTATTLPECRSLEADAANAYFAAWAGRAHVRFTARDAARVPDGWTRFVARRSPLHTGGRSPRNAADPSTPCSTSATHSPKPNAASPPSPSA